MMFRSLCLFVLACSLAPAQPPALSQNGVVNAASRIPSSLTGNTLARGSRVAVRGVRFNGARVWLDRRDSQRISLKVISAQERELEIWLPGNVPLGDASLVLENADGGSRPFEVIVIARQPGLFSENRRGWGQGDIRQQAGNARWSLNSPSLPAQAGQLVEVAATGLGAAPQIQIVVGGRTTSVVSISPPTERGIDHIRFRVPAGAPNGCYVPVYAKTSDATMTNVITMAIGSPHSRCEAAGGLLEAGRTAIVLLSHAISHFQKPNSMMVAEELAGIFFRADMKSGISSPFLFLPPVGTCTAYTGSRQTEFMSFTSLPQALLGTVQEHALDAGTITLRASQSQRTIPSSQNATGTYWMRLGYEESGSPRKIPFFLTEPQYTISSAGSREIGQFERQIDPPRPIEWTNRDDLSIVRRDQGALVRWKIQDDSQVLIVGAGVDPESTAGSICVCLAAGQTGRFRVPADFFSYFPQTTDVPGTPMHVLFVASLKARSATPPSIKGLDRLWLLSLFAEGRFVEFR